MQAQFPYLVRVYIFPTNPVMCISRPPLCFLYRSRRILLCLFWISCVASIDDSLTFVSHAWCMYCSYSSIVSHRLHWRYLFVALVIPLEESCISRCIPDHFLDRRAPRCHLPQLYHSVRVVFFPSVCMRIFL